MERAACPSCGTAMDVQQVGGLCPACLLREGMLSEGTATRLRCEACHGTLLADARFCARCGTPAPMEPAAREDLVRAALEARLQAQYRIVRLLGRGGMGSVYLARDLTLDREVAIKVVKTASTTPQVEDRLRREARTAARLSHPNIVPLHAFGVASGLPYFVMGYVRGESLATRLRRDGRMSEDAARPILVDLAEALDHAHRQGIVHRDVKPDNVLLDDESGRALLTDFGVAKALGGAETSAATGAVVGTPQYMSPEQAAGRADVDGRSDIYSLGAMAWTMLCGRLPFEGATAAEVLTKHLTQQPPPLRSMAPTVSDAMLQAVDRCLAKDPAHRWPDARSLRDALGGPASPGAALPEAIDQVQSQGFWLVFWTLVGAALAHAAWTWRHDLGPGSAATLGILATIVVAAVIAAVRRLLAARAQGIPWAQVLDAAFWPPLDWSVWYPARRRRPQDVWCRLPASVRALRVLPATWLALSVVLFPLAVIGTSPTYPEWSGLPRLIVELVYAIVIPLSALSFAGVLLGPAWVARRFRRQGLRGAETLRFVLTQPTARPGFWARPHVAALLAPASRPHGARPSDSPHEQLQSVLRNGQELSGSLRVLGTQAAVAARQLVVSIEHADREIAELSRSLDAREEGRLRERIEALDAADRAVDPVRHLLEKQLELVRELAARLQEAREERSRKVELLKTLALHVTALRVRATEAPAEVPSLSERVRALCDQIGSQALALAEARFAAPALDDTPTRRSGG
jgi:hypothetical protein